MKLIIIGGGPGAYETAIEASKRGLDVTLISESPLGGTCLNEGCIPTKTFCHFAENSTGGFRQRHGGNPAAQKRGYKPAARRNSLYAEKVEVVYGRAQFVDAHTFKVGEKLIRRIKSLLLQVR